MLILDGLLRFDSSPLSHCSVKGVTCNYLGVDLIDLLGLNKEAHTTY